MQPKIEFQQFDSLPLVGGDPLTAIADYTNHLVIWVRGMALEWL